MKKLSNEEAINRLRAIEAAKSTGLGALGGTALKAIDLSMGDEDTGLGAIPLAAPVTSGVGSYLGTHGVTAQDSSPVFSGGWRGALGGALSGAVTGGLTGPTASILGRDKLRGAGLGALIGGGFGALNGAEQGIRSRRAIVDKLNEQAEAPKVAASNIAPVMGGVGGGLSMGAGALAGHELGKRYGHPVAGSILGGAVGLGAGGAAGIGVGNWMDRNIDAHDAAARSTGINPNELYTNIANAAEAGDIEELKRLEAMEKQLLSTRDRNLGKVASTIPIEVHELAKQASAAGLSYEEFEEVMKQAGLGSFLSGAGKAVSGAVGRAGQALKSALPGARASEKAVRNMMAPTAYNPQAYHTAIHSENALRNMMANTGYVHAPAASMLSGAPQSTGHSGVIQRSARAVPFANPAQSPGRVIPFGRPQVGAVQAAA